MDALLDVTVVEICRTFLPEWNQEFAGKFRKGLSIDLLEHEVL
jgi:FKBP-type peptidyl-prolyl cis-trans isomerase (trigger factor)